MLDGMRKAAQGPVGKFVMTIVMGLIIVSFVIWGVGDMLRGFSSNKVATVGSTTITAQQFANEQQTALSRLQQQLRRAITPQQARQYGLDQHVLEQLIDEAAFNERARALGLGVSDQTIIDATRDDPGLKGADGQFSRALFEQSLRNNGLSERGYMAERREFYLRQQIQYALVAGFSPPKALTEALQAAKAETREIAYFALSAASLGDIPAPSDETLKTYFNERKAGWRAPEYRSFDLLLVTPASLAKPDQVSEDDARAQYEKDKAEKYTVAEKRKLQQIVFPTEAEALAAADKIKAGASFDDIAKERHLSDADIDIGVTTKAGAFDPALAEAAFAVEAGGVTAPVKGKFGFALAHVVSVTPGSVKPFAEVAVEIKQQIAASRAADQVQALHDKIEDAKSQGKNVADAAKAAGLEARAYVAVDRDGKTVAGDDAGVPESKQVLPAVFASDVGVDDEAIATQSHGYVWFSVTKIDPTHDRAFEEVKDKVVEAWKRQETTKRLADKAAELVKQLDGGANIAEVAKANGAEVKTAKDIRREGGADLAANLVAAVFEVGPMAAGSAGALDSRLVFKVTGDTMPPVLAEDPGVKMAADRVRGELGSALVEQYTQALKREIGVSIDRRVLQSAEGG